MFLKEDENYDEKNSRSSLIASLTIKDNAQVVVPSGVTLTVGNDVYTDCVLTSESL